jgi:hypothetical protein
MPREDGDEKEERRPKAMMHIICSGLLPDATLQRRQNNDDNNEKKFPETKKKERNVGTAWCERTGRQRRKNGEKKKG